MKARTDSEQGGTHGELVASPPAASARGGPLGAAVASALAGLVARPLTPGLYIVATPIGHLGDITLRALATLASVDRIYCEDTRHSLKLLQHFAISRPLAPYHEHNADGARPKILAELAAGARLALISDAGTPLISDPGYKLVRDVLDAGHHVTAIPGPSAVVTALAVAGLPTDRFTFAGFPPPKAVARRARLAADLAREDTVVLYEAPSRLAACLADLAALAPHRPVAVARELTKIHEAVLRGPAQEVATRVGAMDVKGECVVVIAPAPTPSAADDATLTAQLQAALASAPLSEAVRAVATATGAPRKRVYDLALGIKQNTTRGADHGSGSER